MVPSLSSCTMAVPFSLNVISDKHAGEAMDNMRFGLEEAMCLSCRQGVVSARRPVDKTIVSCGQYTKLTH